MARSIYITSAEGHSGKSTVALGVLDSLSHATPRVGVFRAIARSTVERDYVLEMLLDHDGVDLAYEECIGVTYDDVRQDPDAALADSSAAVQDWSGGTRIGETLREFNRLWSRRVLGQGAIVLLITDGLEREDVAELSVEMERLRKSCRRLIWLNPLLRFEGFEPRARGVRAMLPHVDEFRAVHNLEAMADLVAALSGDGAAGTDPRRYLTAG